MSKKASARRKKERSEGAGPIEPLSKIIGQLWRPSSRAKALGVLLGLAAVWGLLDCVQVDIAFAADRLGAVVDPTLWQWHGSPAPILAVLACLAMQLWRPHWLVARGEGDRDVGLIRLRQLVRWTLGLVGARLLILWSPTGFLVPYLSLLWSPHATWAWCLTVPLLLYLPVELVGGHRRVDRWPTWRLGLLLFAGGVVLYGNYTLYFCQVTMLHGDEAQYLRITQSLLHDGDMDLANNLDPAYTNEFHNRSFGLHQAHQAVAGKVYNRHPIGLSVLLLPAYWFGLEFWQNPRLACALFMVLMTAACVALSFVWLVRLGLQRRLAVLVTGILMTTAPFAYYSNQLYPEIPGLLIGLVVLVSLAHWVRPGGGYRSLGRWEPARLVALALLVACLPFLHPRFLPLALLLATGVALQAWRAPDRRGSLVAVGAAWGGGLVALLAHHYAFSGDWLGHFRPGTAYDRDALETATWFRSLPGHWLHPRVGLAASAPIFLLAPLGIAWLALRRDRRLLPLAGLYGATLVVYGLHPDWKFGFCYPARFFIVALPALLGGLAMAWPLLLRRAGAVFVALLALTISLDGVFYTVAMPEYGFEGINLKARSITSIYPWNAHFSADPLQAFPWRVILFWSVLLGALGLAMKGLARVHARVGQAALIAAFLWPFVWGQLFLADRPLQEALRGRLHTLASQGGSVRRLDTMVYPLALKEDISLYNRLDIHQRAGHRDGEGVYRAVAQQDRPGVLASGALHVLTPGFYAIVLPDGPLQGEEPPSGYIVVSLRETVPVVSPYEERVFLPLVPGDGKKMHLYGFINPIPRSAYMDIVYMGSGNMAVQTSRLVAFPQWPNIRTQQVEHLAADISSSSGEGVNGRVPGPQLAPGYYRARFDIDGPIWTGGWWYRTSEPIRLAAYSRGGGGAVAYPFDGVFSGAQDPTFLRPLAQRIQAPWMGAVPWKGQAFDLHFYLGQTQEVGFAIHYEGPEAVHLSGITIYKEKAE
ncbi:MAG: hypothetical protein GKR89_08175 [Candidatus Latescibacteria bacterium]|nr:hypothetical protein [Candidatus Latescibacterota bacterium]